MFKNEWYLECVQDEGDATCLNEFSFCKHKAVFTGYTTHGYFFVPDSCCGIIPDSAIEKIRKNLIQAFSPPNKVQMSIPHPYGMRLK